MQDEMERCDVAVRTYRQPRFSAGPAQGGDRAGLSMDAQKRTKREWDDEVLRRGKKSVSPGQGGGYVVGANEFWEPGRSCREDLKWQLAAGRKHLSTECDSLIFECVLKQFSSDPTVWID